MTGHSRLPVYAYVLDDDGSSGVGGLYIRGIGLILALSADRDRLRILLPTAATDAIRSGCPLRLVRLVGDGDTFTAETVDPADT